MTIDYCRAEQLRCAALYPDPGAWLGCHDYFAEEILMEIEDLKRDSARLTWLIEEAYKGREHLTKVIFHVAPLQYIDWLMAQAKPAETNADAERARWCEEKRAKVEWGQRTKMWLVAWYEEAYDYSQVAAPDRNTAIDKARGVK